MHGVVHYRGASHSWLDEKEPSALALVRVVSIYGQWLESLWCIEISFFLDDMIESVRLRPESSSQKFCERNCNAVHANDVVLELYQFTTDKQEILRGLSDYLIARNKIVGGVSMIENYDKFTRIVCCEWIDEDCTRDRSDAA